MAELIIYYSRAAENFFSGSLKYVRKGNTEIVAEKLAKLTGGTLFQVEPVVPYSEDYEECLRQVKQDQELGARPAVRSLPQDFERYDLVTLVYPNFWGTLPMHMYTLLEQLDFSGKTVRAVCTHEGSGMGYSEEELKKLCPGARILKGLIIRGGTAAISGEPLRKWCSSLESE